MDNQCKIECQSCGHHLEKWPKVLKYFDLLF